VSYLLAEKLHELAASSVTDDKNSKASLECSARLSQLFLEHKNDSAGPKFLDQKNLEVARLTKPEKEYLKIVGLLIETVLSIIHPSIPYDQGIADTKIESVKDALNTLIKICKSQLFNNSQEEFVLPLFSTILHPIYILHETILLLSAVSKFLGDTGKRIAKRGSSSTVESLTQLTSRTKRLPSIFASKMEALLDREGLLDHILGNFQNHELGMQKNITELVGEDWLESWASGLLESWRESVEGLVGICKKVV
jgi:hypothetical protein